MAWESKHRRRNRGKANQFSLSYHESKKSGMALARHSSSLLWPDQSVLSSPYATKPFTFFVLWKKKSTAQKQSSFTWSLSGWHCWPRTSLEYAWVINSYLILNLKKKNLCQVLPTLSYPLPTPSPGGICYVLDIQGNWIPWLCSLSSLTHLLGGILLLFLQPSRLLIPW